MGIWLRVIFIILCIFSPSLFAVEKIPKNLIQFTELELAAVIEKSNFVQFIQQQNQENMPLSLIKALDAEWQKSTGLNYFMTELLSNQCAFQLLELELTYRFIVESFIVDQQGALVCMTEKTSDYWQGDENIFIEAFAQGAGQIYYKDAHYDLSTAEMVVQVSIPVRLGQQLVGIAIFSISLDRWERR